MLWTGQGGTHEEGDFFSLALARGYVELSFKMGKLDEPFTLISKVSERNLFIFPIITRIIKVRVDDGRWHRIVAHRRKRIGVLRIDSEDPIKGLAPRGAKSLKTNGKLWIGK